MYVFIIQYYFNKFIYIYIVLYIFRIRPKIAISTWCHLYYLDFWTKYWLNWIMAIISTLSYDSLIRIWPHLETQCTFLIQMFIRIKGWHFICLYVYWSITLRKHTLNQESNKASLKLQAKSLYISSGLMLKYHVKWGFKPFK